MSPGETVSRSLLDKPLHQLTEDDISQVTREDCRRYLKEKGMRRPSWNKSQAIQQVICLKTLLETTTDTEATEARRKLYSVPSHSAVTVKETCEPAPCRRQDAPMPDFSGDSSSRLAADSESISPSLWRWLLGQRVNMLSLTIVDVSVRGHMGDYTSENMLTFTTLSCVTEIRNCSGYLPFGLSTTVAAKEAVGQMTIFYSGKVNVYDDMPSEKAQAILQLAASPLPLSQKAPSDGTTGLQSVPCHLQTAGINVGPSSPVIFPTLQTVKVVENCQLPWEESNISHEDSFDGPTSRKASVQRYREKRKDRFKNKRKIAMPSSSSLDVYLNRWVGDQFANEQLNPSDVCSTLQSRPSQTSPGCGVVENLANVSNLPVDPNDKDVTEN
ncbi:protein TIFY 4B [Citrus sinensis]|uniref:Protein TIFY 4B n=1 Tax=Citrus sinensis TaxID=2711 RepID=A0ACB8MIJ8_CITSI|nr:protein TIFY 4B [Citrus sinensis]KAH9785717.1 protein TIFY 4B [Citrus sinensis]